MSIDVFCQECHGSSELELGEALEPYIMCNECESMEEMEPDTMEVMRALLNRIEKLEQGK